MDRIPDHGAATPAGDACLTRISDRQAELFIGAVVVIYLRGIFHKSKGVYCTREAGIGVGGADIGADPFRAHLSLAVGAFVPVDAAAGIVIALLIVSTVHVGAFVEAAAGDIYSDQKYQGYCFHNKGCM